MLAEWYFCCCISASPSDTTAFLSILETLENSESDSQLLYLTYDELQRTEDWMQVYALPQVLKSLHRENLPAGVKDIVKRYFNRLANSVPEEVGEIVQELIDSVLSQQPSASDIIKALKVFAEESKKLPERRLAPTPYFDLKEFLPETLVLAVIADQLTSNREFNPNELFSELEEQQEKSSPVSLLLQNALDYQFGRLAFRLAVLIAHIASNEYSQDNLRTLIAEKASSVPELEPDLLQTYATVLFWDDSIRTNSSKKAKVCERIIQESWTLTQLRRLLQEFPNRDSNVHNILLRRMGFSLTENRTVNFPIICWQATLWELALQIDEQSTARELVKFWHPPGQLPNKSHSIKIGCPEPKEAAHWKEQLESLLTLQNLQRVTLEANTRARFFLDYRYAWLFLSPWIYFSANQYGIQYSNAEKPELLVRLIASVFVSIRLLQKLSSDNFDNVEFAAKLVAHASSVIDKVYGQWLKSYGDEQEQNHSRKLSPALTGLALFARRQIRLAGTGQFESTAPQIFIKICENRQNDQERTKSGSTNEQIFFDLVLPEVLMSWIKDAYPSAVGIGGSARWLDLIPDVYLYHKLGRDKQSNDKQSNDNFLEIQEAALVTRFLCPTYQLRLEEQLDWRTERNKKSVGWKVHYQQLLLTERQLDPDEWLRPEWNGAIWGKDVKKSLTNRLVRALELLDAIGHWDQNYRITPQELKKWYSEWKNCLNSVGHSKDLDRLIRLRLLEFLDSPILQNRPEEQKLIAFVLLEYGSTYELKRMFERVYRTQVGGRTLQEVNSARQELQTALLQAMYNNLEKHTALLKAMYNDVNDWNQRRAQDPRKTRIDFQQAELCKAWITKITYLSNISENKEDFAALGTLPAKLRQGSLERQAKKIIREKTCDIELRNNQKLMLLSSVEQNVADWSIKAAVYDPNRLTTTLFYEDFDTTRVVNLFERTEDEIRSLKSQGEDALCVLAVVVYVELDRKRENQFRYTFNCGFSYAINYSLPGQFFEVGDYVELPIKYKENTSRWGAFQNDDYRINPLQHRVMSGDIKEIRVHEYWKASKNNEKRVIDLDLKFDRSTDKLNKKVDLHLWDADISRNFRNFGQPDDRTVFARLDDQKGWLPIDYELNDLLIKAFNNEHDSLVVLTLIEAANSPFGEIAWRFSRQPGENYLLERHDFLGNDAEELQEAIANYPKNNSRGLLISVKPDIQDGKAGLKLVTESVSNDELNVLYPDLNRPFDDRNIKWRKLFDQSEKAIAENDGNNNWYFKVEENFTPGYPRKVRVDWEQRHPSGQAQTAELIVTGWDESQWREAVVRGEQPPFYKITPENRDWHQFLNWLLNNAQGHRVKLERTVGLIAREGDGFVTCMTNENLRILVEAESLTMRPLEHQKRPNIGENRDAEIFSLWWNEVRTPPQINREDIPDDAIRDQRCQGILTRVPEPSTGNQCTVVWQTDAKPIERGLWIDNRAELNISQGCKLVGIIKDSGWHFHIESPYIQARALWSINDWKDTKQNNLCYLGNVFADEGERWEIAESQPGELVRLPQKPRDANHLAIGDGVKFQEGLQSNQRTKNTAKWKSWHEGTFEYRRAVLTLNEELLIGNCKADTLTGNLSVKNVSLVLYKKYDKYVLRRRFDLQPAAGDISKYKQEVTKSDDVWQQRLAEYLQKPTNLNATFAEKDDEIGFWLASHERNEIKVPIDSDRTEWTFWVSLAPDEGAFVVEGDYSNQATVRLFEYQNQILASCRRVPHLTLEQFRVERCEAPLLNTPIHLLAEKKIKLYYVGFEESNEITGERYEEIHHRFEMGYGETLLVPESQLEFEDGPFKNSQFLIFHSDLIKVITFKEENIECSETEETLKYIINIKGVEGVDLQWSQARWLYNQRKQCQIVHLLHLSPRGKQIEISYIDGFNERGIAEKRSFKFKNLGPQLTEKSRNRLSSRLQKWEENSDREPVIFGRLDEDRYIQSRGKELFFEHVRLSFEESELGPPLINEDLVFLKAREITEWGENDMALQLEAPKGFDNSDIGSDIRNHQLRLLRRSFSVRENLLKQVYESDNFGKYHFQNSLLLVRLTKNNQGKVFSFLLMEGEKVPTRKASALRGEIDREKDKKQLATVVKAEDQGEVQIELHPGIFVKLKPGEIEERPEALTKGAVVQIEAASADKFRIIRAAFGDAQYVSEDIRPAAMLPKNDLFKVNDPSSWLDKQSFAIGGLPNIVALPGSYDKTQSAWHWLQTEEIVKLMQTQHPKIVCLGKDADGIYRIAPPSDDFPCGRLVKVEDSLSVSYALLNPNLHSLQYPNLSWHLLSFGDESVQQIIERANVEKWRYHDNKTRTWSAESKEFNSENLRDRYHDVWTGPIFFQSVQKELRLRYTKGEFRKFGFPVEELIYALKQQGKSSWYPVAGIYNPPESSLWIELAPGRIVELPTQLIYWRSGVNDKPEFLGNLLHWQGFSPGDRVELELVSKDPMKIAKVALKNWIPGSRNAFGPQRAFLPVLETDTENGALTLGGGEFTLKLPFADRNTFGSIVILTAENRLIDLRTLPTIQQKPKQGDTVLLSWDDAREKPIVLGFDGLEVYPTQDPAFWENEPLPINLIISATEGFHLNFRRLKQLLTAIGGILPITVEKVSEQERSLYFSMRHQRSASLKDSVSASMARVVGMIDDYTVVLRCGGELLKMPMRQIVSGLDQLLFKDAAEALKQSQALIWLRREEDGEIKVRFQDESKSKDILVESLDLVLQDDIQRETGLICRSVDSMALYWLPINQAAWTNLSVAEFRSLFRSKGRFKVRAINKNGITYVSVLAVQDVYEEAKSLTIGKELIVKFVRQSETNDNDKQRYLVESFTTQVILDLEIYDHQRLEQEELIPVEVARHIKGAPDLITVVPVGKKQKFLDLPTWMIEELPEPGQRRKALRNYILWRRIEQLDLTSDHANSLDRLLCHAYNDAYGTYGQVAKDCHPEFQLKVAEAWEEENRYKLEINVAYAIMTILLLEKNGARNQACKLTQNLGRRALRSMHVEVLYQKWLAITDNRQRDDDLWRRLRQLEADKHLRAPLEEKSIIAIRQFCNAVELRNDSEELLSISKGLSAALGELSSIAVFDNYAEVTKSLIDIYRTLPSTQSFSRLWLHESQINKLLAVLRRIDQYGLDITLLEPLDYKEYPTKYQNKSTHYRYLINLLPLDQIKLDKKSKTLMQIIILDDLIEKSINFGENIKQIQDGFQRLRKILKE